MLPELGTEDFAAMARGLEDAAGNSQRHFAWAREKNSAVQGPVDPGALKLDGGSQHLCRGQAADVDALKQVSNCNSTSPEQVVEQASWAWV